VGVMKLFGNHKSHPLAQGQQMIACGTKGGNILIYQVSSGNLLAHIENAHYLTINDLDVSNPCGSVDADSLCGGQAHGDLIITGGKDTSVKVWKMTQLLSQKESQGTPLMSWNDHSAEVTQVRFSFAASILRAFSSSLDKTFRVYDLPSKVCIKQI